MPQATPEANEIMELERRGNAFMQAGDVASIVEYFSDESLVLSNGAETVTGKENIRQVFSAIAASDEWELSWEPVEAVVSASGDMAYVHGTAKIKTPADDVAKAGKYIIVWVRQNGQWRVAVDIQNTNS